jgi:hypothetical protein
MAWMAALNQCGALNNLNADSGYAGITSWRLATTSELETLQHGQSIGLSVVTANFPATQANPYRTGDTMQDNPLNASYAHFNIPYVNTAAAATTTKTNNYFVRCVASPALPAARSLTDNGDGTISDAISGLR